MSNTNYVPDLDTVENEFVSAVNAGQPVARVLQNFIISWPEYTDDLTEMACAIVIMREGSE